MTERVLVSAIWASPNPDPAIQESIFQEHLYAIPVAGWNEGGVPVVLAGYVRRKAELLALDSFPMVVQWGDKPGEEMMLFGVEYWADNPVPRRAKETEFLPKYRDWNAPLAASNLPSSCLVEGSDA